MFVKLNMHSYWLIHNMFYIYYLIFTPYLTRVKPFCISQWDLIWLISYHSAFPNGFLFDSCQTFCISQWVLIWLVSNHSEFPTGFLLDSCHVKPFCISNGCLFGSCQSILHFLMCFGCLFDSSHTIPHFPMFLFYSSNHSAFPNVSKESSSFEPYLIG